METEGVNLSQGLFLVCHATRQQVHIEWFPLPRDHRRAGREDVVRLAPDRIGHGILPAKEAARRIRGFAQVSLERVVPSHGDRVDSEQPPGRHSCRRTTRGRRCSVWTSGGYLKLCQSVRGTASTLLASGEESGRTQHGSARFTVHELEPAFRTEALLPTPQLAPDLLIVDELCGRSSRFTTCSTLLASSSIAAVRRLWSAWAHRRLHRLKNWPSCRSPRPSAARFFTSTPSSIRLSWGPTASTFAHETWAGLSFGDSGLEALACIECKP